MAHSTKTEALVLRKRSLLGQDALITFFSMDLGKVTAVAKGIRKITSRRASHIQTGNLVHIALNERRGNKYYLEESRLASAFSQIKASAEKMEYVYAFFFMLDRILPDLQPEYRLYTLTKKFLIQLSKEETFTRPDLLEYLQQALAILGYGKKGLSWNETIRDIEEIIHEKVPLRII